MKNKIKLLVSDLDGTLTDGIFQVSDDTSLTKSFYTNDFYGMEILQNEGIHVLILTASEDNVIDRKIAQLPERYRHKMNLAKGIVDKEAYIKNVVFDEYVVEAKEIAYIGDGENDIKAMEMCGLSACPSNSMKPVFPFANYVCEAPGGRGAVYEFVKYILDNKEKE